MDSIFILVGRETNNHIIITTVHFFFRIRITVTTLYSLHVKGNQNELTSWSEKVENRQTYYLQASFPSSISVHNNNREYVWRPISGELKALRKTQFVLTVKLSLSSPSNSSSLGISQHQFVLTVKHSLSSPSNSVCLHLQTHRP